MGGRARRRWKFGTSPTALAVIVLGLGAAACSEDRDPTAAPAEVGPGATAAPSTTAMPTIEASTTGVPAPTAGTAATETAAPATQAPATEAPATQAPATEAPPTQAPATEAAVTEAPATEAPTTEVLASEASATEAPATEAPATEAPATEPPGTTAAVATEPPGTITAAVATEPASTPGPTGSTAPAVAAETTAPAETTVEGTTGPTQAPISPLDVTGGSAIAAPGTEAPPETTAAPDTTAPSETEAPATEAPAGTEAAATTQAAATTATPTGTDEVAATAADTTVTTAAEPPNGPTFGTMAWPCGPAEETNADDGSEPGVTADQIVIGYGDDAGFEVVPGLNHEASDAITAMVTHCNELGGINGRQLVANYYDSKLTQVNTAILAACRDQVFWLVGTAWAFDEQQEEIRQSCGLPASPTYTISGAFSNAPLMYQGNPNPVDEFPGGQLAIFAQLFPEEVQSAGALSINVGAALTSRDKALAAAPNFGWEFVSTDLTSNPMGEQDWTPFVNQLRDAGVEAIYYSGQCLPMLGLFAESAAANGYEPVILGPGNLYEPACLEQYPNLNNLYVDTVFVPMEEAQYNKATQDYLDLVQANGGDVALLGMQATSSFLLWAQAADACGASLTRDCVLENLANTHEWTAGGLHAPSDPGGNHPATCSAIFKSENGAYVRAFPEEPATFACSLEGAPPFLTPIEIPGLDAVQLDENRISRIYSAE